MQELIILVVYVSIGNLEAYEVREYLEQVIVKIGKPPTPEVFMYFLPTYEPNSRIECLNPKLMTENEFANVRETLDKMQETLNQTLVNLEGKNTTPPPAKAPAKKRFFR